MARTRKASEANSKPNAKRRLVLEDDPPPMATAPAAVATSSTPAVSPAPKKTQKLEAFLVPKKELSYETPQKKARVGRPKHVTPGTPVAEHKEEYVPTYLHKNVEYLRKGTADLDSTTYKVFELVEKFFTIPEAFEQSRLYGPLSGTCFEERVISAYALDLLVPRDSTEVSSPVRICTFCATEGHKRDECGELI